MNLMKLKVASEKSICFLVAGLHFTSLAADGATRPSSSVACITLLGTMSKQECGFPLHAGWLYFSGNCIRQQKCVLGAKFHRDVTPLYVSEFDCSSSQQLAIVSLVIIGSMRRRQLTQKPGNVQLQKKYKSSCT